MAALQPAFGVETSGALPKAESRSDASAADVVIVGGTPGGIMAAIAAARLGRTAIILERTSHIGGLPANGLGATDIGTRGATGGLFLEFVGRIRDYYVKTYGENSEPVKDCSDGYHFEPSVAEKILNAMIREQPMIQTRLRCQFDAAPENVKLENGRLTQIQILDRDSGKREWLSARVFIDATYEGDLAAAAGAPFRLGREGKDEFKEPMAGKLYKQWGGPYGPGSTGEADQAIQSYNYRLALTKRPDNRVPIPKPATYNRNDYASIIEDLRLNRSTGPATTKRGEVEWDGIGRAVNIVHLPNNKTDANNQHAAFVSTDLPEENWPWPTATWEWRDRFAQRQRDYTLGLLWFCQNDPELPAAFRERCSEWGLAADEYGDNGHFPRQVYVREGRRITGEYLFTANDARPTAGKERPPIHQSSITASHYSLDSHAVRKREPNRVHLDGFFSEGSKPYTVPYGVIMPLKVEGLLTPVPASATHVGFSTLRMEPCWMALGQAAGVAASLSVELGVVPRKVPIERMQRALLNQGAILIYFSDLKPGDPHFTAVQWFGLRGWLPDWKASLNEPVSEKDAVRWIKESSVAKPASYQPGKTTRGELLGALFNAISQDKH
ncbi:MAG: FAD-dependent oxidoreductase [Candidatus Sumerlaeota bacterium]|nr:FAD-dependent oxidoreductase [Candidatus Sumerlaeota bacterium]